MKIKDIYKKKTPVFSCEVFPPNPHADIDIIYSTISDLKELSPDFISVTYGAGGGTKDRTVEISSQIKNEYKLESLMHMTCIDSEFGYIEDTLTEVKNKGIENILALRGDSPSGEDKEIITKDFRYAVDLINFIKKRDDFCLGVAGYPEVHPESKDMEEDINCLKKKIESGADFIITQLFFQNDFFYRFLDKINSAGINVPVSAGVMPVFKSKLIKKIVSLCGSTIPAKLQNLIDKYAHKPKDMEKAGIDYATDQIIDLLNQKVNGIHLYTMNNARLAQEISRNTSIR